MTVISVKKVSKGDPPPLPNAVDTLHITSPVELLALEGGMGSGRTSMAIHVYSDELGRDIIIETSVDAMRVGMRGMQVYAEQFGDKELP